MDKLDLAVIVGSNRRESINRRLARALVRLAGDRVQARFIRIDDLPIYNQDLEPGRTPEVHRFTAELARAEAILIVTPEHNRSIPAVLKNAIDWGSKPADRNVWRDKVVAITGASPGAIGTAVGQQHLRQVLGALGALVVGGEAYVSFKPDLVEADDRIAVEATREFLGQWLDRFLGVASRMRPLRAVA
ncbi:NADPH-dependent FMN reductase [Arenimonas fontis]|uniref:NAD(P)H-dependent oxidoreductase n=1 Tax=Arenimonas fontis TaxID=2608255 RepID=A0A5B2Z7Z0_9GAMM|nr:NADPH-dependent FMN reductase [Arenimonas fontis]KAA2284858.1 NAD(P)H-dependent oxidoreductase [Arenimonas fontis]